MKSSRVLMHIDLKCIDIIARTHRKNFSTCRSDSPFFLQNIYENSRGFVIFSDLGTREAQARLCFTNTMAT